MSGQLSGPVAGGSPSPGGLEVWAHHADGTALLLRELPVPPGARRLDALAGLDAISERPALLAVRVKGPREVAWHRLRVVARVKPGLFTTSPGEYGAYRPRADGAPDAVVYLIDTLRQDALAHNGGPVPTPAFDRLAADGTRFDAAITTSSWTRPATASMLTGTYPSAHGAIDRPHVLPESAFTLAERMRFLGYRTAAVTANGNVAATHGFDQGFEAFSFMPPLEPSGPVLDHARAPRLHEVALEAWRADDQRPLFLYVHTVDPHGPYMPPDWLLDEPRPAIYGQDHTDRLMGALEAGTAGMGAGLLRDLRTLYAAEVAYADREFGRFFGGLSGQREGREVLLVLTSDHGEAFMEHGHALHGRSLHREELDIPLILWGAGVPRGGRVRRPVSLIDVLPTLLAAAGAGVAGMPGQDLRRLARGEGAPRPLLAELELEERRWSAIRSGPWTLLRDESRGRTLLYDRRSDAAEAFDLSRERIETASRLRLELQAWQDRLLASRLGGLEELRGAPDPDVVESLRALGYLP